MEKSTLGMLSYSPVLAFLVPLVIRAMRERKILLRDFEKLLIIFAAACLLIYLPYLKHGVIETGVRDHRFLLPLYLPLFYFIATRVRPELDLSSALALSCFVVTTIVLTCLTKNFEAISTAYFATSAFLNLLFIFAGRFRNMSDLFSLAFFASCIPYFRYSQSVL